MAIILTPYINFKDNAREAMEFYHSVLGGELTVQTFGDFHAPVQPDELTLVMHSQVETPNGLTLMASDSPAHVGYHEPQGFSVSLSGAAGDGDTLRAYFDGLAAGGTVTQPLETAPWGAAFGMLVDKFGISWLVNISSE